MQTSVRPVPVGYRTLTPTLIVRDGLRAMAWYQEALGATELSRFVDPVKGFLAHGEIQIGSSRLFLAEEAPDWHNLSPFLTGGPSASIALEVDDVDAVVAQAIAAGARLERPVEQKFYGERSGVVVDPFGHRWDIATRTESLSPEEMQRRYEELLRQPAGK
jgi:PhnB protein